MLFQIFHDVRINYTLCFIGKSIFCSYYFSVLSFQLAKVQHFFELCKKMIIFTLYIQKMHSGGSAFFDKFDKKPIFILLFQKKVLPLRRL